MVGRPNLATPAPVAVVAICFATVQLVTAQADSTGASRRSVSCSDRNSSLGVGLRSCGVNAGYVHYPLQRIDLHPHNDLSIDIEPPIPARGVSPALLAPFSRWIPSVRTYLSVPAPWVRGGFEAVAYKAGRQKGGTCKLQSGWVE